MSKCESESHSVMSDPLEPHGLQVHGLQNSSGRNTGVGSLSLLQGVFPTQGLNPGLLHCRRILYQLSHKGSPMDYYSALKRNEVLTHVTIWWYLENMMLSEKSQTQRPHTYIMKCPDQVLISRSWVEGVMGSDC